MELFISNIFTGHPYCRCSYYCHYHDDDDDDDHSILEVLLLEGRVIPCIFMQAKKGLKNKLFFSVCPRSHC
jgi:major membrane immunogen (membrane-anchored lipoprotein)